MCSIVVIRLIENLDSISTRINTTALVNAATALENALGSYSSVYSVLPYGNRRTTLILALSAAVKQFIVV